MESIENLIEHVHKMDNLREQEFLIEETKQITEFKNLMGTLRTLKDEQNDYNKNISKNLQSLTTHKHLIHKLIHNSEDMPVLPVSHDYQKAAMMFLAKGIDVINKLGNIYTNFNDNDEESSKDSVNHHNITTCVNDLANELHNIKSLVNETQILQKNTEEVCLVHSDEDMEV